MDYNCDVLIVGGGLGGLCAGAYLSQAGLRVTICEQSDQTGGYFRGFTKDGFYFDTGLKAVENAGMLIPMLRQLGIEDEIRLRWSKCCLAFPDKAFPLASPRDIHDFYTHLADHFPSSRKGLEALLREARRVESWVNVFVTMPNPLFEPMGHVLRRFPSWAARNMAGLLRLRRTGKLMDVALTEHLSRYVSDSALIRILSEFFFAGTPALFGLGYSKMYMDYYYPAGGMQRITDVLTQFIIEHGGTVRTRSEVVRINVNDGKVTGAQTREGEVIGSRFIVTSCDMKKVFLGMIDAADVERTFRDEIKNATVGESAVNVFVATDLDPLKLKAGDSPHIFFYPDYHGISQADRGVEGYFASSPLEISIPCLNDPSLAPPGRTGIIISTLARADFADNWGIEQGVVDSRYESTRKAVAAQVLSNAENLLPGLRERVLFTEVSTPATLERYTMNSGGSIIGWTYDREKTYKRGYSVGMRKAVTTPIYNLFQAGHWSIYPGGAPMCILSGKLAADQIIKRNRGG